MTIPIIVTSMTEDYAEAECPIKISSEVVIDKRGDVLLQVGTEAEGITNLLVSSKVLSLASRVFDAMFNSGFAEGQNLSSASPRAIPLPNDDPRQMTMLCKLVHMQTLDIPETLQVDDLARFAICCDKWDCANGVRAWSRLWLSWYGPKDPKYITLYTIAFILDLPHEFATISRNLLRYHIIAGTADFCIDEQSYLSDEAIDRLWNRQSALHDELKAAIVSTCATELLTHSKICHGAKELASQLFLNLHEVGLLPIRPLTLEEHLVKATELSTKQLSSSRGCNSGLNIGSTKCLAILTGKDSVLKDIRAVYDKAEGFCLDCIKNAVREDNAAPCRVAH